ncbi:unnamed protein product [Phytophthora lilii]|uniref:Unnamed protein product n=1 Tax=Phytophthora lilii TaxID=2077276 RepID=A0A9W7DD59_9STRA|nr:unnamed protein product [Phytophthora lilii]
MCSGSLKLTASQVREDTAIQELVASDPNIAGRIILEHLKRLRGATVSLSEVYRARNLILNDMFGSWEDGFQKLESLVTVWKTKNPTSYVDCKFNANGEFVRVFISHPYAPLYEMHGQKVAGVDRAILKHGKYQSDHLALVGRDGDKNNIILGIAVCASESEDNYEWFFRCCLSAGVKLNEMPLFSDRRPGVMAALYKLNVATSRFCTGHIFHNIQENFKTKVPPDMDTLLYRVQAATSNDEYNRLLNTLELTHKDIAAYIRSIDPEQWVLYTALRSSRLYGWRSTNFAGYQDAAASEPRGTLPFQFLQYYMAKFMEDAYNFRSRDARSWLQEGHTLTKYARDKLKDASKAAGFCMVLPTDDSRAFVHDTRNKQTDL